MKRKRKQKPPQNNGSALQLGETSKFLLELQLENIDELTQTPWYTFHIFQTVLHAVTGTEIKVEVGRSVIPGERMAVIQAGLREIEKFVQGLKNESIRQEQPQVQVDSGS